MFYLCLERVPRRGSLWPSEALGATQRDIQTACLGVPMLRRPRFRMLLRPLFAARRPEHRAVLPFPCGSIPRFSPVRAPRCHQGPFRGPEENLQPLSGVALERRYRHQLRHRGVYESFRLITLLRLVICPCLGSRAGLRANSDLALLIVQEAAPTRSMFRRRCGQFRR